MARWSGCSVKAHRPWLMALRVVSLPATTNRMKNEASSASVSDSPSTLPLTRAEVRSSVGCSRRSAARPRMSSARSLPAFMKASTGSSPSGTYSVSPKDKMMLERLKTVS